MLRIIFITLLITLCACSSKPREYYNEGLSAGHESNGDEDGKEKKRKPTSHRMTEGK
jgi:hypothetical protein